MNRRFDYIRYDDFSKNLQEDFKKKFEAIEMNAMMQLSDSRARSLMLSRLEEAYMWIGKAIRDMQIARGAVGDHMPERSVE